MLLQRAALAFLFAQRLTSAAADLNMAVKVLALTELEASGQIKSTGGGGFQCECGEEEFLLDFSYLVPGSYVTVVSKNNLYVKAIGKKESYTPDANGVHQPTGGAARVYDSTKPMADLDLGSPNNSCGGPGVGTAGEIGQPGENCASQNNLLIIQRRDKITPDDAEGGGSLFFTLDPNTKWRLKTFGVLDMPMGQQVNVTTVSRYNGEAYMSHFQGVGPNGFQTINLDSVPVRYMSEFRFDFPSDGAISWLRFCQPGSRTPPVEAARRKLLRVVGKK
jgi:hypothetical protein